MSPEKHGVLIAEDSEDDRFFLARAIRRDAPRLELVGEVHNGDEAVAYLGGEGPYADRTQHPFPELLILDFKMPRKNALEVLAWLRTQTLPPLQVAILAGAGSFTEAQRLLAAELGVKHFFLKTINAGELARMVQILQAELERGGQGTGPQT